MPANVYECLYLLDPNKVAGDVPRAAEQLKTILEKNQAEILASRQWDERRLAYPIKNHKKGLYYLMYFRTEGKNLLNIERDFALSEVILRYLTLKIDPKLVDTMLTLARDEHALALQMAPDTGEEDGGGRDGDFRGPRRGGRRFEGAEK
jgi:small subunit ribosomal protein S6